MALDLARLAKVCGMLGSGHAGERAAAALKAAELLAEAGATWEEFIRSKLAAAPAPEPKRAKRAPEQAPSFEMKPHAAAARELLEKYFPAYINPGAAGFLRDVAGKLAYWDLTESQQAYLDRIKRQCEGMAGFRKKAASRDHAHSEPCT